MTTRPVIPFTWPIDMEVLKNAPAGAVSFGYAEDLGVAVEWHNCNGNAVGGPLWNRWTVVSVDPLTVHPSIHCVAEMGGCGLHGWIINGAWVDV